MVKRTRRLKTRREHLTDRRIEALPLPPKRTNLYDVKVNELGLKLETSGRKTFFWFRAVAGKPTWRTIGVWPDVALETARQHAQQLNVTLAMWVHRGTEATAIYSQLNLAPVRESVNAATRAMIAASKKKPKQLALLQP